MVSLGRPGAGERLLESCGFGDVERLDVPFVWEFADPELYARAGRATAEELPVPDCPAHDSIITQWPAWR